jgi:hypothetical protein
MEGSAAGIDDGALTLSNSRPLCTNSFTLIKPAVLSPHACIIISHSYTSAQPPKTQFAKG